MAKEPDERDKLLKELRGLIKNIDEEGLSFLIQQSRVILHNIKINELNQETEKLQKQGKNAAAKAGKQPGGKQTAGTEVSIERGSFGRSFILIISGQRKIMDQEEIMSLAEITRRAESEGAALEQLYRWLEANRDDVLLDAGIDPNDANLKNLYTTLRKQFKPKK